MPNRLPNFCQFFYQILLNRYLVPISELLMKSEICVALDHYRVANVSTEHLKHLKWNSGHGINVYMRAGPRPVLGHSSASNASQRFRAFIRRFWSRRWPPSVQRSAQFFMATSEWLCIRFGLGSPSHSLEIIRGAERAVGLLWLPHASSAFQASTSSHT